MDRLQKIAPANSSKFKCVKTWYTENRGEKVMAYSTFTEKIRSSRASSDVIIIAPLKVDSVLKLEDRVYPNRFSFHAFRQVYLQNRVNLSYAPDFG